MGEKKPEETEPDRVDSRERDIEDTFASESSRGRKRGIADPHARRRRREQIQTLRRFLRNKDTRSFLAFIRDLGIRDDSKEFAELYEIWVKKEDDGGIRQAFERTMAVRKLSPEARELADLYFFKTLARIHRAGDGPPIPLGFREVSWVSLLPRV